MAYINEGEFIAKETEDALDDDGYVLTVGDTATKVKKATSSDTVFWVNYIDTVDPFTGTASANKMVSVGACYRGKEATVKITVAAGATLSPGDELEVSGTAGVLQKKSAGTVVAVLVDSGYDNSGGGSAVTIKRKVVFV